MIKKILKSSNIFFLILLSFLFYMKYPEIKNNFDHQGSDVESKFKMTDLVLNNNIHFPDSKRQVVLFWATWCAPCKVELARLNNLVKIKQVSREQIIAISLDEKKEDVSDFLKNSKYAFQVVHDTTGKVRNLFDISVTPTTVFIDENNRITWRTTGVSPSLEVRVLNFLR